MNKLKIIILILAFCSTICICQTKHESMNDHRDGQSYPITKIGEQWWMAKNSNYYVQDNSWCYEDNSDNCEKYGRLYNWSAARKACPAGWRLPSKKDVEVLFTNVDIYELGSLKSNEKSSWLESDTTLQDNSGFNALGAGERFHTYATKMFADKNKFSFFWTSTKINRKESLAFYLYYKDNLIRKEAKKKGFGFSVRCIKKLN